MSNNHKKDKNIRKTLVFKQIVLVLVLMLCFENICFSHENISPESIFGPLNSEQVNQIGELEAHILMKLLYTLKKGTNLLEQAKTGREVQDITIKRPYDQTRELVVAYDLQKVQEESKSLPDGYYIVPSTYDDVRYYHFIKFSDESYNVETFTEQEYLKLNKDLLKNLIPLPVRKEAKRIKSKRKHEIEIDSIIWKKAKQGYLKKIQNNAPIIGELLELINGLEVESLKNEIQTLIKRNQIFLITGDVENLSFVGHASDRGIYLVKGKGDNLPVLFWEIMKFRGLKQEQELGIRTQILRWQKNKKDKPTIEVLKKYLVKNRRETLLKDYPDRAYWGAENSEEELLLQLAGVLGKIEETRKLIKTQKELNAIESKLDEQKKKQAEFKPEETEVLQPYVDALATIQKCSKKLQRMSLRSQDVMEWRLYGNANDIEIKQTVAQFFNSSDKSPKTHYRNLALKFHPDRILFLNKNVSMNIQEIPSIKENFEKIFAFITNAWEFYLKKDGNTRKEIENFLIVVKALGEIPITLRKAFDFTEVIETVNRNVKQLETERNALKQNMAQNANPEKTLQDLARRKGKILNIFGAIDQHFFEHKKEAVTAECLKTLEVLETEKEEAVKKVKQIFIDQETQIGKEKEENKEKRNLEYRKKEKAKTIAEEKHSQTYSEFYKIQKQTEHEFYERRCEAYETEKQVKRDINQTFYDERDKIWSQEKLEIKKIEEKYSQEVQVFDRRCKQIQEDAKKVFDKESSKLKEIKEKLIKDAKQSAEQKFKTIKIPRKDDAYIKAWSPIYEQRQKIIDLAEKNYLNEWSKIYEQRNKMIDFAGSAYSDKRCRSRGVMESATKKVKNICTHKISKLEKEKERAIKIAEGPYSRIRKEGEESKDIFEKKRSMTFKEERREIGSIEQEYTEFCRANSEADKELDKKLDRAKILKQNATQAAEKEFKSKKKQAEFKRDTITKTINQLIETDFQGSVSAEHVSNAKGSAKSAIDTLLTYVTFFKNRKFSLYEFQSKRFLSFEEREKRAVKQGVAPQQVAKVYSKTTVQKELEILEAIGILTYAGKGGKQNLYKLTEAGTRLLRNPVSLKAIMEIPELNQYDIYGRNSQERIEKLAVLKQKVGMHLVSEITPQPTIPEQKTLIHVICKDLVKDFRDGLRTVFTADLLKIARKNNRDNRMKEKIEFVSKHELLARVSALTMNSNNIVDVALSDRAFIGKLPENVKSLVFESYPSSDFINMHGVLSALRALQNDDIITLTEIYKILTGQEFDQMEKLISLDRKSPKYYQEVAKLIIFHLPPVIVYDTTELKKMNKQMLNLLKSA
ncbi:MAG: hypothetical protein ABIH09_05890 [Candidatus Omnitrophota bacterium]